MVRATEVMYVGDACLWLMFGLHQGWVSESLGMYLKSEHASDCWGDDYLVFGHHNVHCLVKVLDLLLYR